MNERLARSASPYLRAHADNPVDWYPWGAEAFAQAVARDVPVMISIGYSTCHWCHVMARESFEDAGTAAQMNAQLVAIKVDREEHPEVDDAYLAAASAFTPNLGWPLTVFATPDGRAFFAGTYFPNEPRGGMASFRQVLDAVHEAWTDRRADALQAADAVTAALARTGASRPSDLPDEHALVVAIRAVAAREDREHGGFAPQGATESTPKFPSVPVLRLLQTPLSGGAQPEAAVARRALAAMATSPLRDPVDGGFFRYATRRDWTVPHYERMLTDNAGLVTVALDAAEPDTARGVARFLTGVLQQPGGGFAAAQDSESWIDGRRSEGGYYAHDAAGRAALTPPAVDGKIITGWNGMAVAALADAGVRLAEPALVDAARRAAGAVLAANTTAAGTLRRASLGGVPSQAPATLEDYGLFADGLAQLACATGDVSYAVRARELVDACIGDATGRARAPEGDAVLAAHGLHAPESAADADHPSGPAAMAAAALRLWLMGAGDRYRQAAASVVREHVAQALQEPFAHAAMLRVAAGLATSPRQLVVVGGGSDALTTAARAQRAEVFAVVSEAQARAFADAGFALFADRRGEVPTVYDCRDFTCRLPVTRPEQLPVP